MLQEKQNYQASSMPGYFLPFSQAGPETQQSESTLMVLEGGRKWRTKKKKKKQTAQDLLLGASYMEEWWESESWAEDIYRLERPRGGLLRTHTPTQWLGWVVGCLVCTGIEGGGEWEVLRSWSESAVPSILVRARQGPGPQKGQGGLRVVNIHALAPQSSLCTEGGYDQLSSQQRPWMNPSPILVRLRMTVESLGLTFKALHWTSGLLAFAKGHQPEALMITYVSHTDPCVGLLSVPCLILGKP